MADISGWVADQRENNRRSFARLLEHGRQVWTPRHIFNRCCLKWLVDGHHDAHAYDPYSPRNGCNGYGCGREHPSLTLRFDTASNTTVATLSHALDPFVNFMKELVACGFAAPHAVEEENNHDSVLEYRLEGYLRTNKSVMENAVRKSNHFGNHLYKPFTLEELQKSDEAQRVEMEAALAVEKEEEERKKKRRRMLSSDGSIADEGATLHQIIPVEQLETVLDIVRKNEICASSSVLQITPMTLHCMTVASESLRTVAMKIAAQIMKTLDLVVQPQKYGMSCYNQIPVRRFGKGTHRLERSYGDPSDYANDDDFDEDEEEEIEAIALYNADADEWKFRWNEDLDQNGAAAHVENLKPKAKPNSTVDDGNDGTKQIKSPSPSPKPNSTVDDGNDGTKQIKSPSPSPSSSSSSAIGYYESSVHHESFGWKSKELDEESAKYYSGYTLRILWLPKKGMNNYIFRFPNDDDVTTPCICLASFDLGKCCEDDTKNKTAKGRGENRCWNVTRCDNGITINYDVLGGRYGSKRIETKRTVELSDNESTSSDDDEYSSNSDEDNDKDDDEDKDDEDDDKQGRRDTGPKTETRKFVRYVGKVGINWLKVDFSVLVQCHAHEILKELSTDHIRILENRPLTESEMEYKELVTKVTKST